MPVEQISAGPVNSHSPDAVISQNQGEVKRILSSIEKEAAKGTDEAKQQIKALVDRVKQLEVQNAQELAQRAQTGRNISAYGQGAGTAFGKNTKTFGRNQEDFESRKALLQAQGIAQFDDPGKRNAELLGAEARRNRQKDTNPARVPQNNTDPNLATLRSIQGYFEAFQGGGLGNMLYTRALVTRGAAAEVKRLYGVHKTAQDEMAAGRVGTISDTDVEAARKMRETVNAEVGGPRNKRWADAFSNGTHFSYARMQQYRMPSDSLFAKWGLPHFSAPPFKAEGAFGFLGDIGNVVAANPYLIAAKLLGYGARAYYAQRDSNTQHELAVATWHSHHNTARMDFQAQQGMYGANAPSHIRVQAAEMSAFRKAYDSRSQDRWWWTQQEADAANASIDSFNRSKLAMRRRHGIVGMRDSDLEEKADLLLNDGNFILNLKDALLGTWQDKRAKMKADLGKADLDEKLANYEQFVQRMNNDPIRRVNNFENMQHLRAVEQLKWNSSLAWVAE